MWLRWLPWRYIVRRVARARGFMDPISVLSRLHQFAEPAEVAAPLELLRAGVVFHARGLMNTAALQHNLDWVWPYWVERQFDPLDESFIPRAFSITHVNLTHRNWTAVGLPDCDKLPIVDPRGLLTPHWDGWSLDAWMVEEGPRRLIPSRQPAVEQSLDFSGGQLAVRTTSAEDDWKLATRASVEAAEDSPVCVERITAESQSPAWLVVTVRPCNPEGVSFLHKIAWLSGDCQWSIDDTATVAFDTNPDRQTMSTYREGDIFSKLPRDDTRQNVQCDVGLATAAVMFKVVPGEPRTITVRIPLAEPASVLPSPPPAESTADWPSSLAGHCQLQVPDERIQFLYDAAIRTLVLHSPGDIYPGPYTYKRFWFRDAVFIMHALLNVGLADRVKRTLDGFAARQTRAGYFLSQEGEWDSNGEALWMYQRYCQLTGEPPNPAWATSIQRGAEWIERKRLPDGGDKPQAGLLPAGFSAEHLGPNDYYYWDDFWSVAGLRAAADLLTTMTSTAAAGSYRQTADRMLAAIERSLAVTADRRDRPGIPAAPTRRLDAAAIGSIVAGYPLQVWPADDPRLRGTVEFLLEKCFVHGGFFQDMIHSGINPYLTLHVAQLLLRAGDPRAAKLWHDVARLATSTGQWPEAIHPRTLGGCMGDGQHVWAAAEWVMMLRNCFVREELASQTLILGSGLPAEWLAKEGASLSFGPAPTSWGVISLQLQVRERKVRLFWRLATRGVIPQIDVRLPGLPPRTVPEGTTELEIGL
ncbi:MAG: hypothetical protein AB7O62_24005 [Pirellulales bacterium]